jgi:hypothetical protein
VRDRSDSKIHLQECIQPSSVHHHPSRHTVVTYAEQERNVALHGFIHQQRLADVFNLRDGTLEVKSFAENNLEDLRSVSGEVSMSIEHKAVPSGH